MVSDMILNLVKDGFIVSLSYSVEKNSPVLIVSGKDSGEVNRIYLEKIPDVELW